MNQEFIPYSLAHHPAPHRRLIGGVWLFFGLFGAPIVCGIDLLADYALVGHACYPGTEPLASPMPGFAWTWLGVLLIHLAALAGIVAAGLACYRMWCVTGPKRGHMHHLMERGEGRDRFLAIVGMGFAAIFFLITAGETIAMGVVRLCAY